MTTRYRQKKGYREGHITEFIDRFLADDDDDAQPTDLLLDTYDDDRQSDRGRELYEQFQTQLMQLDQDFRPAATGEVPGSEIDEFGVAIDVGHNQTPKPRIEMFPQTIFAHDAFPVFMMDELSKVKKKGPKKRGRKRKLQPGEVEEPIVPTVDPEPSTSDAFKVNAAVLNTVLANNHRRTDSGKKETVDDMPYETMLQVFRGTEVQLPGKNMSEQAEVRTFYMEVEWVCRLRWMLNAAINSHLAPHDPAIPMYSQCRAVQLYLGDGTEYVSHNWRKRLTDVIGHSLSICMPELARAEDMLTPGRLTSLVEVWDSDGCICASHLCQRYCSPVVLYNFVAACGLFVADPDGDRVTDDDPYPEQHHKIPRSSIAAATVSKDAPKQEQSGPTSVYVRNPGSSCRIFDRNHRTASWGSRSCSGQITSVLLLFSAIAKSSGIVCVPYEVFNNNQMLVGFLGYLVNIQKLGRDCPYAVVDNSIGAARMMIPGTSVKAINVWPTGKICCYGIVTFELLVAVINFVKMYAAECFTRKHMIRRQVKIKEDGTPEVSQHRLDLRRTVGKRTSNGLKKIIWRLKKSKKDKE